MTGRGTGEEPEDYQRLRASTFCRSATGEKESMD